MDYILMSIQVISIVLTQIYLYYFLMALLVRANTNSVYNNKKYAWKLLCISVVACIISILNLLLNCDFVSISERKTVFNTFVISLIITVLVYTKVFKDAVYRKLEKYEKKIKVGIVMLFIILTIFLVCTILKLFYSC